MMLVKRNIVGVFLSSLLWSRDVVDVVNADNDFASTCINDQFDFVVNLEFEGGVTVQPICYNSYASSVLGNQELGSGSWITQSGFMNDGKGTGEKFEYLVTTKFFIGENSRPLKINIDDQRDESSGAQRKNCGRALWKNKFQDFGFGDGGDITIDTNDDKFNWWPIGNINPVQMTIIPFVGNSKCEPIGEDAFDTQRSLAIWLSTNAGVTPEAYNKDPNRNEIVYCNVAENPKECLNKPFWGVEDNETLVLYGTLRNFLDQNDKKLSIYIPEATDLNVPINLMNLRYGINTSIPGNIDNCINFAKDQTTSCIVTSFDRRVDTYHNTIQVSGLGRILGFESLKYPQQFNDGWGDFRDSGGVSSGGTNMEEVLGLGLFLVNANLLTVSSIGGTDRSTIDAFCGDDDYAIDVSGVELTWGSKLGQGHVQLNSFFANEFSGSETGNHCVKMFDVKDVGNWVDQADGVDIMGKGSGTFYLYTHHADDNIKMATDYYQRVDSTILSGNAGSPIGFSYGKSRPDQGVNGSKVIKTYAHRVLHTDLNFEETNGLIATRACGCNPKGIQNFVVDMFHVPALGDQNNGGANSVSVPVGIGVKNGFFCGGCNPTDYPISNIRLENVNIDVNPSRNSRFYDDTGLVQWGGAGGGVSTYFYKSNPDKCIFQGALTLAAAREFPYFFCGFGQQDTAKAARLCWSPNGRKFFTPEPNVELFSIENGANPRIEFPTCSNNFGDSNGTDDDGFTPTSSPTSAPGKKRKSLKKLKRAKKRKDKRFE